MLALNIALLSLLLPAAALARPNQHERLHHKRGAFEAIHPSGIHGAPPNHHPYPTGGSTAPFPANNVTTGGPSTATGSVTTNSGANGPVTISSVITVIPVPPTSGQTTFPNSPESSILGAPAGSPSSSQEGPGGSGTPGNSDVCGPATVTVTKANTVTVTVPAADSPTSSSVPVKQDHQGPPNVDAHNTPADKPSSKPVEKPAAAKPKIEDQTVKSPETQEKKPAIKPVTEKPAAKADSKPVDSKAETVVKASAAPKAEKHAETPQKEVVHPVNVEAPKDAPKSSPVVAQKNEQPPVKAAPKKDAESSTPKKTDSKPASGGGKGILYGSLDEANGMNGMNWGCNWDSSPKPAVGHAQGQLNYEFVPQLWGPDELHTSLWAENSKDATYVMAFNEPNIGRDGGGCGPMEASSAVGPYEKFLGPNRDAKQKIVSPCVSNNAPEWLDSFIGQTSLKPDAVCFHWYGETAEQLKNVVKQFQEIQAKHSIPELWMSEWAFNMDVSSDEAQAALEFLASSAVDRWAYNHLKMDASPTVKAAYMS